MKNTKNRISFKKLIHLFFETCFTTKVNRLPRGIFWLLVLISLIPFLFLFIFLLLFIGKTYASTVYAIWLVLFYGYFYFWSLYLRIRLEIARLHDVGKSGWMELLHLVPLGFFIGLLPEYCDKTNPKKNVYGEPFDESKIKISRN